ncbi:MAG: ABC transporter ATP-binding protein [Candidatus Paceibacterota bacterium]
MEKETLLKIEKLFAHYGKNRVLEGVDIAVGKGEIAALTGPNGSGKSTLLKAIFGLIPIQSGRVFWQGKPIIPQTMLMVDAGIAFVPQGRRVFPHLTVEENLEMGGFTLQNKRELEARKKEAMEIFPVLSAKRKAKAGTLSGGEQQMAALARGLMTHPKLLLLDEPTLGLASDLVDEVFAWIQKINHIYETAFIVVEHNTASLLAIAHQVFMIDKGELAVCGNHLI